jgi:hypothetical protein
LLNGSSTVIPAPSETQLLHWSESLTNFKGYVIKLSFKLMNTPGEIPQFCWIWLNKVIETHLLPHLESKWVATIVVIFLLIYSYHQQLVTPNEMLGADDQIFIKCYFLCSLKMTTSTSHSVFRICNY